MWILGKPVENIKVSDFCPNRGSTDSIHWVIYRCFIMSYIQTSDLPVSSSCARHPWDRGRLRCAVFDSKTVGLQVWICWNCGTLRNKKSGQIDAQFGKLWCDWCLFFPIEEGLWSRFAGCSALEGAHYKLLFLPCGKQIQWTQQSWTLSRNILDKKKDGRKNMIHHHSQPIDIQFGGMGMSPFFGVFLSIAT